MIVPAKIKYNKMISSHNKLELWYPLNDTVKLYSRFSPNMQSKKKKKNHDIPKAIHYSTQKGRKRQVICA